MTRFLIAAAATLAIASPVFAQSQLERSLGSDAGAYSVSDLVAKHFEQDREPGDGPRGIFGKNSGVVISTSDPITSSTEFALRHFAQDHETGDGPRYNRFSTSSAGGTVIVSTSDNDLASFARKKLENDGDRGFN